MVIVLGVILAVVIVLMIIIFVVTKDRKLEFVAIEKKLKNATLKYMEANPELLPKEFDEVVVISASTLEMENYFSAIGKMVKGETVCNAEVKVMKNGEYYLYLPYLNCGEEYTTKTISKKILEDNKVVDNDDGLYNINGEYVFRGLPTNNYVKFANENWFIMKIDKDNDLKLLQVKPIYKGPWDNRYNIEKDDYGINQYEKSYLEKHMDFLYDEDFFTDKDKKYFVFKKFCIGSRGINERNKTGKTECSKLSKPQPIGLIYVSEFLNASLDKNCLETYDLSCQNYNYLADCNYIWSTMTPMNTDNYRVYTISKYFVNNLYTKSNSFHRLVIHLSGDIIYASGVGTEDDPYILKID